MELFRKKSIGLDISNKTIEVAELEKGISGIKLLNLGRTILRPGIVEHGIIKDPKKLSEAVKRTLSKASPHPITNKKIVFGLPESQVYTYVFILGPHNKKERDNLILEEAHKNIPLKKEDLLFSYKILKTNKNNLEILLIATSRKIVLGWQEFFRKIGLKVVLFDFEPLAIFRGIFAKSLQNPVCIIDIGAYTTNISIFKKQGLYYSHSIDLAGNLFTKEISKSLKIKLEEAEERKIEIGLEGENSKIFSILSKSLKEISKEVKILIDYFQQKTNQKITDIVLVGGSSKLSRITDYFNATLGLKTRIGQSVLIIKRKVPLEYIQAIGLALRKVDDKWAKKDPALKPLEYDEELSDETAEDIKIRFRRKCFEKKILIIILIIGIILISLSCWCRNNRKIEGEERIKAQFEELDRKINKYREDFVKHEIETEDEIEEIIEERELVLIKETETGWLNVRDGAGVDYSILTKIYPGESYPLLKELEKWYKIELNDGREGWVFNEYVSKQ